MGQKKTWWTVCGYWTDDDFNGAWVEHVRATDGKAAAMAAPDAVAVVAVFPGRLTDRSESTTTGRG